ncbi:MAG: C25 family cysteine peptidase [Candidatus Cloacimonetes bacterium]|nr:C25 family cysteine peptidase [Candidatus Cloacimonadota bacterium]
MALAAYIFFIFGLACQLPALALNDGEDYISLTSKAGSICCIEINLSTLYLEGDTACQLHPDFAPYLGDYQGLPQLRIPLAVPFEGAVELKPLVHYRQLGHILTDWKGKALPLLQLSEPYWLRDIRGMDLIISPLELGAQGWQIADAICIEIVADPEVTQAPKPKLNPYFVDIYKQHFINFSYRYPDLADYGSLVVISPPQFMDILQPWINWKMQKGIPVSVYTTMQTGQTYDSIKYFLQELFMGDPDLTFVQFVGDYDQIQCLVTGSGGQHGGRDADYALLKGDDFFPDVFVSRFSAENRAELYTQIKRSIEYERDLGAGIWLGKAAGVCSSLPPIPGDDDEHNWEHLDNIRARLLNFTYDEVDRIYANEGAGTEDLIACLNEGCSLVNFCGEGFPQYWPTPYFHVSDAENLTNAGMLPFIHVVACNTGQFYNTTCLAEAFMRSRDETGEQARGAIAIYASAPHQGVAPPMRAQDHFVDLLLSGGKNTIGGLCYNGCGNMIDVYGEGGEINFWGWNLFGDASLVLKTRQAEEITVSIPEILDPGTTSYIVQTDRPNLLCALSMADQLLASAFTDDEGRAHLNWEPGICLGDLLLITITGFNVKTIQQEVLCLPNDQLFLSLNIRVFSPPLEPGINISRTAMITNNSTMPANDVTITLISGNSALIPQTPPLTIPHLDPGASQEVYVTFTVVPPVQDYSTVSYAIAVVSGSFSQVSSFTEIVHAPILTLTGIRRHPQVNWICANEEFSLVYHFENTGSAPLRNLSSELISLSSDLQILGPTPPIISIPISTTDSLSFTLKVLPQASLSSELQTKLILHSPGLEDHTITTPWQLIDLAGTAESFETGDLNCFPWTGDLPSFSVMSGGVDGLYCLKADSLGNQPVTLALEMFCTHEGCFSFFYKHPASNGNWELKLNETGVWTIPQVDSWQRLEIDLPEGRNTIYWVGRQTSAKAQSDFSLALDAIQFPPGAIFNNATMVTKPSQLSALIQPGEIKELTIELKSADGKHIQYNACLQSPQTSTNRGTQPYLLCDNSTFTPGTTGTFLFKIHNANPPYRLLRIELDTPTELIATYAGAFTMANQTPLLFLGELGSMTHLEWASASGSYADSLGSAVRMVSCALAEQFILPYRVYFEDVNGLQSFSEDNIMMFSSSESSQGISLLNPIGELHSTQVAELVLRVNQNLLPRLPCLLNLEIFYNGFSRINIPVSLSYDNDTPGFFDEMHLKNFPNPIQSHSVFAYAVPGDGVTDLTIYNLRGQKLKTLFHGNPGKGYHHTTWDLRDDQNLVVVNGIYFCRLRLPSGRVKVIKIMVLK